MSKKENLPNDEYNGKIMQAFGAFEPGHLGKEFLQTRHSGPLGRDWKARPDSGCPLEFQGGVRRWMEKRWGSASHEAGRFSPSATLCTYGRTAATQANLLPEENACFLTACRATRPFISPLKENIGCS